MNVQNVFFTSSPSIISLSVNLSYTSKCFQTNNDNYLSNIYAYYDILFIANYYGPFTLFL